MYQAQVELNGAVSPVPVIEISPAPLEHDVQEPRSPFTTLSFATPAGDDSFRPYHLSPPPTMVSHREMRLPRSPLAEKATKGLDQEQFQAMLRATRERNSKVVAPKKSQDLRKEVALKVHNSRTAERRAIFLSKIAQPPSPTATLLPKTPPESPAVFHFSLPSPGLQSPLAMFDDPRSAIHSRQPVRVEKVDFRSALDVQKSAPPVLSPPSVSSDVKQARRRTPPSLDQISARFSSIDHGLSMVAPTPRSPIALPGFLQKRKTPQQQQPMEVRIVVSSAEDDVTPLPSRETAITSAPVDTSDEELSHQAISTPVIFPDTASLSAEPEEDCMDSRARTGRDMLAMLRRRTVAGLALRSASVDQLPSLFSVDNNDRKLRRRSAHASSRSCSVFSSPFLKLPGAF